MDKFAILWILTPRMREHKSAVTGKTTGLCDMVEIAASDDPTLPVGMLHVDSFNGYVYSRLIAGKTVTVQLVDV